MCLRAYLLPCFIFFSFSLFSQTHSRIKADFTIKEKTLEGKNLLVSGSVYYDINQKKIVYDISFPEKEIWVIEDTTFYQISKGKITHRNKATLLPETSVFHLSITNNLGDFGLKNRFYKITDVQKEGDMVITALTPPTKYSTSLKKILISQKQRMLYGVAIYNHKNQLTVKEIYSEYKKVQDINFPVELMQITYKGKKEINKLTTYKNIVLDEKDNNSFYNYKLPR
ncbi:MAG: hypothetical protein NTX03_13775 [Bacteroidetes bacterium]|nr:hypothetical protein [Bacteroidota bacterium]